MESISELDQLNNSKGAERGDVKDSYQNYGHNPEHFEPDLKRMEMENRIFFTKEGKIKLSNLR